MLHSYWTVLGILGALLSSGRCLASCPPNQQAALWDMYTQCNGPQWPDTNKLNWGSGDACTWKGVTCGVSGHVESLVLEGNDMSCQVPDTLGNLTMLKTFDISSSNLFGTIPSAIRYMRQLQRLRLYQNRITGTLPPWLGELAGLQEITVVPSQGSFGLTGSIPGSAYSLLPLQILVLDNNGLTGNIPRWVQTVPLHRLRGNYFTGPCPQPVWIRAPETIHCGDANPPVEVVEVVPLMWGRPLKSPKAQNASSLNGTSQEGSKEAMDPQLGDSSDSGWVGRMFLRAAACALLFYGYLWYQRQGYSQVSSMV